MMIKKIESVVISTSAYKVGQKVHVSPFESFARFEMNSIVRSAANSDGLLTYSVRDGKVTLDVDNIISSQISIQA